MSTRVSTVQPTPDVVAGTASANNVTVLPTPTKATAKSRLLDRAGLVAQLVDEATERARARAAGEPLGPEVAAISPRLHRAVSEALPIGVTAIDGPPGAGKTAFGTEIAMTCRVPALIIECEVRPIRMLERMTSLHTATFLRRFKDGSLTPAEIGALARRAVDENPLVEIIDASAEPIALTDIMREALALRDRHGAKHVMVLLDSLHAWAATAIGAETEHERADLAILSLDSTTKRLGVSVVAIFERSMATMGAKGATNGKGSATLGYKPDLTLNLDPVGQTILATGRKRVALYVAKNRDGEDRFVIPLEFEGRIQRFFEIPEKQAISTTEDPAPGADAVEMVDRDAYSDGALFGGCDE